jgi:hypothetical protein
VRSLTKFGNRTAAPRTAPLRTVALLIVGVLVAPAFTECVGWAAGRHACCANRGGMDPETALTPCCGMSEQSNDAAPPEARAAGSSLKLLVPHFAVLVDPGALRLPIPVESFAARRAAVVPLYLQQASLLI